MNKFVVKLKNCHGINCLDYEFDFTDKDYIIYATNGSMKTSFYKTIDDFKCGRESKDLFFPERVSSRELLDENGNEICSDNIILVGNQEYVVDDSKMTALLVNNKLKKEYDEIFTILNKKSDKICKQIKTLSGDKIEMLYADLGIKSINEIDDIYYSTDGLLDFKGIKYSEVFNDDNEKIFKQSIIVDSVRDYIEVCNKIISEKEIFVKDVFELHHLKSVYKTLSSSKYFEAGHLVRLMENRKEELYRDYNCSQLESLISDVDLTMETDTRVAAVNVALTNKIASQKLNVLLSKNQWIIPWLADIQKFKRKYWQYIISTNTELITLLREYVQLYNEHKEKLSFIISESNKDDNLKKWKTAVDMFNRKFINMPFKLSVSNLSDVILKNSACSLEYSFSDAGGTKNDVNEDTLKDNLSKGERNAFSILNLMFEMQYYIDNNKSALLIIDDIADSFDYKNKYAIIEFLKELSDNSLFNIIILTHNFDFYRSCSSRLGLRRLTAVKTKEIKLIDFHYTRNVFTKFKNNITQEKFFFASIPFVRNIIEMSKSDSDLDYLKLTSALHYKSDTDTLTTNDVDSVFVKHIGKQSNLNSNYLTTLFRVADSFTMGNTKIELENKLVLSIAIRMKFEIYMFGLINDWNFLNTITSNQTKEMIEHCINKKLFTKDIELEISDKVRIMVSDNIHVNAFMYEPIIDMSDDELINLYNLIKNL